jgi:hypothetical protein
MSSVVYLDPSINAVLLPEVHVVLYVGHAALPILTPKCCHKAAILMEISKFKPNTVIAAQLPPSVAQSTSHHTLPSFQHTLPNIMLFLSSSTFLISQRLYWFSKEYRSH